MHIKVLLQKCWLGPPTIGGINKEISNLGKDLDRDQDEAGMTGNTFASAKKSLRRIASKLDGAREKSGRRKSNQKDSKNRAREE